MFTILCLAAAAPLLASGAYVAEMNHAPRSVNTLFVSTALEYYEPNATAIEKRTNIKDCFKSVGDLNNCFDLGKNIKSIVDGLGLLVKRWTDDKDCSIHTGALDGLQFRYEATGNGNLCGTTAQLETLRGAIDEALKKNVDGKCNKNVCLRMTHGGTWHGYFSFSPAGGPAPAHCYGEGSDPGRRAVIAGGEN
ncbi:hypothetical protein B0H13DRAFT_1994365 [Mycena leptocephala]|nr:hypothetical protein B0H13DRAFT_1994365 [Mycena leptocephala]